MKSKAKPQGSKSKLDIFLWLLVIILISAGVVANYYFSDFSDWWTCMVDFHPLNLFF